jgi:hypothetical protein
MMVDTTTTVTNATPITIADNPGTTSPYPSEITIAGAVGSITNVTVTFHNLSITRPRDLDILLVGPGGQALILMSDVAGSTDVADSNNVTITLSDGSPSLPSDAIGTTQLLTGTYRPTNNGAGEANLPAPAPTIGVDNYPPNAPGGTACTGCTATFASIFAQPGVLANGVWSLYVDDDGTGGNVGANQMAGGWTLSVTTNNVPSTAASVGIGGRVVTSKGVGVSGVRVAITAADGETHTVLTDELGYYHFDDAEAGQTYIFSASHKRYHFAQPTQVVSVSEDLTEVDFVAFPYRIKLN